MRSVIMISLHYSLNASLKQTQDSYKASCLTVGMKAKDPHHWHVSTSLPLTAPPTWQRSSLRRGDGACVVHPSKKSQLGSVCRDMLVLPLRHPPACPHRGAPVRGLRLLGRAQVVEVPAVGACADGAVQAHGALARLLGLALSRPHVQTCVESQRRERMQCFREGI